MSEKQLTAKLRRKYTELTVFQLDKRALYKVWLNVGSQSFCIAASVIDNKREAEWFRTQLAVALAKIVKESK